MFLSDEAWVYISRNSSPMPPPVMNFVVFPSDCGDSVADF